MKKRNDDGLNKFFSSLTHDELFEWMCKTDGDWKWTIEIELRRDKIKKIKSKIKNN